MPAVTIQLYEQRLSFFNIRCYWYVTFNWAAFTPSLRNNSLMFLGTVSPYFQSTESRQSDLTLEFMCEHTVVQTWSICIVHLFDHSDWFDSGMVMWLKLIQWYSTLRVYWTMEEEKLRNCIYWGCLPLQDEQAQTSRVHHIKWASQRMKPVQRKAEPNDRETWVLMTMFVLLDPSVPEASISSGFFSFVNQ